MADINNSVIQTITIDTTQADQSLAQLEQEFNRLAQAMQATQQNISGIGTQATAAAAQFANLQRQVEQTDQTIVQGAQAAVVATTAQAQATEELGNTYNRTSAGILSSLRNQRAAFRDVTEVINGQQLKLTDLSRNFGILSSAFGPWGIAAAAAVGIVAVAFEKLGNQVHNTQDAMDSLTDAVVKDFGKQIGEVEVLTAIIRDNTASEKERKQAIDDLIKQHPAQFANLKDTHNILATLKIDEENYTKAIIANAYIQAANNEVGKLAAKNLEIQIELQETLRYDTLLLQSEEKDGNKDGIALAKEKAELDKKYAQNKIDDNNKIIQSYIDVAKAQAGVLNVAGGTDAQYKENQQNQKKLEAEERKHDQLVQEEKNFRNSIEVIGQDARTREIEAVTKQANALLAKAKDDAALRVKIHQDLVDALTNIDLKYEAKEEELDAKAYNDHIKRQEQIKQSEQKANEELEKGLEEYGIRSERTQKNITQAQTDAENLRYNKLKSQAELTISSAKQLATTLEALAKQHQANLLAIQEQGDARISNEIRKENAEDLRQIKNSHSLSYSEKQKAIKQDQQLLDDSYDAGLVSDKDYTDETEANTKARMEIKKLEVQAQTDLLNDLGSILGSASELVGKNTELGKDLAIAQTIISTYSAAQKSYEAMADIPYVGPALGAAAAAAAVVAGIAKVKAIEAVSTKGGSSSSSSGGASGGAINSPLVGTGANANIPGAPAVPANGPQITTLSNSSIQALKPNQNQTINVQVSATELNKTSAQLQTYSNSSKI